MCHTATNTLQTKRKDAKVFGDDRNNNINGIRSSMQLREPSPGEEAVSYFT
jgi:hypothetical protein